jgi:type I restriction enzyme S subunit
VTVPLGSKVRVLGGGTPTRTNPDFYGGDVPWVTPKDMKAWDIRSAQVSITRRGVEASATRIVPAGAVLIVVRSGVLKHTLPVGIARVPVAINQDMKALVCDDDLHPDYVARLIKERSAEILSWVRATTADNFSVDQLKALQVDFPPIEEQRRIADILDRADALVAQRRSTVALLDDLAASVFLEMFGDPVRNERGWGRVALGKLLDRIDSGTSPVCLDRPVGEGEWGVLKLSAVTTCVFQPGENKALPPGVTPKERDEVQRGDVLFTRKNTRELVGACAMVDVPAPRLLLPDLVFRLKVTPGAGLLPIFLQRLLSVPTKRLQVQALAGGSAGSMPNISKGRLSLLPIELPPLELQREFQSRITRIADQRSAHQVQGAGMADLHAALQHRAFRGEL